jgi:hypothetical protein
MSKIKEYENLLKNYSIKFEKMNDKIDLSPSEDSPTLRKKKTIVLQHEDLQKINEVIPVKEEAIDVNTDFKEMKHLNEFKEENPNEELNRRKSIKENEEEITKAEINKNALKTAQCTNLEPENDGKTKSKDGSIYLELKPDNRQDGCQFCQSCLIY